MVDYWILKDTDYQESDGTNLSVSYTEDVSPLDDQWGVYPKRCWPLELEDFFTATSGQHCFVLLDAAQSDGLIELLATSDLSINACIMVSHCKNLALSRRGWWS